MKPLIVLALASVFGVVAATRSHSQALPNLQKNGAPGVEWVGDPSLKTDEDGNVYLSIEIKNTGTKNITIIDWKYISPEVTVVRNDPSAKIEVEQTKELTLPIPSQHYIERLRTSPAGTLSITRVVYEDGSRWELSQ